MKHHVKTVGAVDIAGARNEIGKMRVDQQHAVRWQNVANGVGPPRCQLHGMGIWPVANLARNFIHPATGLGIHLRIAVKRPADRGLRQIEVLGQLLEIHGSNHGTFSKRFQ